MTNAQSRPLGFLDLPTELRLMVYELLPNRTIRTRYVKRSSDGTTESSFTIISYVPPTAILTTCKTVHNEAVAVVRKTAQQLLPGGVVEQPPFVTGTAPKIETEISALPILGAPKGIIKAALDWCFCYDTPWTADCDTFLAYRGFDMSSLLKDYGYFMEDGTFEKGVFRLLYFIRKAGYMLHLRRSSASLRSYEIWSKFGDFYRAHPARTFHIAVTRRNETPGFENTAEAVREFGRALGPCDHPFDIVVRIHTLTSAGTDTSVSVCVGETSVEAEFRSRREHRTVLVLGRLRWDQWCEEDYNRFWVEGEWKP